MMYFATHEDADDYLRRKRAWLASIGLGRDATVRERPKWRQEEGHRYLITGLDATGRRIFA